MAHYGKSQATRSNDWTTPPEAWGDLVQYIPDGAIIWESAYCDGASGGRIAEVDTRKTRSKKLKIIHEKRDFFTDPPAHYTHQITNPPFDIKKRVARAQHKPRQTLRPATAISDDRGEVLQRHIYKK